MSRDPYEAWMLEREAESYASRIRKLEGHGQLPAPTVEQLLEPDPDLYLAGGPLAPDHCECAGVCECDCTCLEYGHGMNLTRVISCSCAVHGGGDDA